MHWPNSDIVVTRVTSGGAILDPSGIMVATTEDPEERPSVAFDGSSFVVTWKRSPGEAAELYVAGDGTVNLGDVVFLINFLFKGGPSP